MLCSDVSQVIWSQQPERNVGLLAYALRFMYHPGNSARAGLGVVAHHPWGPEAFVSTEFGKKRAVFCSTFPQGQSLVPLLYQSVWTVPTTPPPPVYTLLSLMVTS